MAPQWDLIIVGGGAAGLAAAVFASDRGGKVLVIDSAETLGGTLLVSHGQISAAGTKLQAEKGIDDSPEKHYQDALAISRGTIDRDLAHLAIFNAAETFDWLMDCGFDVMPDCPGTGSAHLPYSVPRYYWGEERGASIAKVLKQEVLKRQERSAVTIRLSTEAIGLAANGEDQVNGVIARNPDGSEDELESANVLLACGGYAGDAKAFEERNGVPLYVNTAYPFNKGTGLKLGESVGGYVRGKENYLCNSGWVLEGDAFPCEVTGRPSTYPETREPWEIWVNVHGRRYIREDEPSVDVREHALLIQPNYRYWIVFDDAILKEAPPVMIDWTKDQVAEAFESHPMFYRADTVVELARRSGTAESSLERTVEAYNASVAMQNDPLGRMHMPKPISSPPFYAIQCQGTAVTATAGLAVDEELRVIRKDGTPIKGLYAAGEILGAGQLQGNAFVGGMMAMPSLTFGRLLGQSLIPMPSYS